jgi:hypothetical protein
MVSTIPMGRFQFLTGVADIQKEHQRLKKLGVEFTMEQTKMGPAIIAAFKAVHASCNRSACAASSAGVREIA